MHHAQHVAKAPQMLHLQIKKFHIKQQILLWMCYLKLPGLWKMFPVSKWLTPYLVFLKMPARLTFVFMHKVLERFSVLSKRWSCSGLFLTLPCPRRPRLSHQASTPPSHSHDPWEEGNLSGKVPSTLTKRWTNCFGAEPLRTEARKPQLFFFLILLPIVKTPAFFPALQC